MTEVARQMAKETIIYFDRLGFGWVVDGKLLSDIKRGILGEEDLPSRSLMRIIENILSETAG